jgi:hypothetical protein
MEAAAFRRGPGRPRLQERAELVERQTAAASAVSSEAINPAPEEIEKKVILADLPTSRVTLWDMGTPWGEWLYVRLDKQWPGKTRAYWQGKINNVTSTNDFLFIKNETAVLLVMAPPHLMDDRSRALEVFAWSRLATPLAKDPTWIRAQTPEAQHGMASLYRYALGWMRQRNTPYMVAGICTDMPVEKLERDLRGECADWVVLK